MKQKEILGLISKLNDPIMVYGYESNGVDFNITFLDTPIWRSVDEETPNTAKAFEKIIRKLSFDRWKEIDNWLNTTDILLGEQEKENVLFEIVHKASLVLVDVDTKNKSHEWIREYILENAFQND